MVLQAILNSPEMEGEEIGNQEMVVFLLPSKEDDSSQVIQSVQHMRSSSKSVSLPLRGYFSWSKPDCLGKRLPACDVRKWLYTAVPLFFISKEIIITVLYKDDGYWTRRKKERQEKKMLEEGSEIWN
ncbi:Argonaute1d [Melia azedarach]|uniref:Argonaute1d n=1 Tax=Melia azedarach TaxID=155640 RepID=A0ACC1XRX3_MELAZ|nr:Argonaute1d [Melia azedarach]